MKPTEKDIQDVRTLIRAAYCEPLLRTDEEESLLANWNYFYELELDDAELSDLRFRAIAFSHHLRSKAERAKIKAQEEFDRL